MARQLTEQLEREVSAEELMKQTRSNPSPTDAPNSSAHSGIDPYYTPNEPTPQPSSGTAPAPPVSAPAGAYSPETAAAVHGADWHASPPENQPVNE